MPRFGKTSRLHRSTLHPDLQQLVDEVVESFDITVLCGHRNEKDQNEAYDNKKSKVKWPDSMHNQNPSLAVDIAPYPIRWPQKGTKSYAKDLGRFYMLAGYIRAKAEDMGIDIRGGHDWDGDFDIMDQDFDDLVHWELKSK